MTMFSPENVNLARRFMAGPGPSQRAGQYPDMAGFSKTPQGKAILERVLGNMQARRRGQPRAGGQPQRRPAGREPLSNVGRRP